MKKSKLLRKIACTIFLTTALSFIIFFSLNINFVQYLGISIPLILFLLTKYFYKGNIYWGGFVSLIALTNLGVFLFEKFLKGFWICFDFIDFIFIIYTSLNFIMLCLFISSHFFKHAKFTIPKEKLFSERKYELERIKIMLINHNIIGINAQWGDGKTFLFKRLEKDLKDKYIFLTIKVLSVTIDSVEKFILNEINYQLENESIFSITSSKIKWLLSQPALYNVGDVFLSASSYTRSFEYIKKDIQKIGKPIVISFEDIDRIESKEILFKIFSIVDMLSCDYVKFVYQYEENQLLRILGTNKLYLEKYIPYTTSLAPISFEKNIQFFCKNEKYSNLEKDIFNFFSYTIIIPDIISKRIQIETLDKLEIPAFSIRKMQIFLEEVNSSIKKDSFKSLKKSKQSIIIFYYIKHFCYSIYQKIDLSSNFLEAEIFEYDNKMYSLKSFLNIEQKSEILWNNSNNKLALKILILLGYNFKSLVDSLEIKENTNRKKNIDDFFKNVDERENNDKINRMIKNLYAAGKSEYTNYEKFVIEMDKSVLGVSPQSQKSKFKKLYKKMYYGKDMERDNRTIYRFLIPELFDTFQAFEIYESNPVNWIKLIDFYFQQEEIAEISPDFIRILNYCNISNKSVYLHILNKFNNLKIIRHLKDDKNYLKFLDKYLSAISALQYVDTREVSWLQADYNDWNVVKKYVFDELKKKLTDFANKTPIEGTKNEVILMIAFIDKNIQIIESTKKAENKTYDTQSSHDKQPHYHKQIKYFEEEKLSSDEIKKELNEGYERGLYKPYEVNEIWDYFQKKQNK
ncbi:hypothetical protein B7990_01895 [Fibrobacter sp. UWB4]|uniref:P-loop NTPase fold protein n=1 Tax=Fibrobacter sp. UWB4 TaxID=1964356 RepID=UPI000B51F9A1|nr:P-loop NTPase fold protein [Fibrobacter sp. UWB4]OWV19947.1 hypothetical protein B7990_01895 [Fibrobacter sp. UWB4]